MNGGQSYEFSKDSPVDPLAALTAGLVGDEFNAHTQQAREDLPQIELPPRRYTTEDKRDGRNLTEAEVTMLNAYLDAKQADPSTPMPPDVHAYYFPPEDAEQNTFGLYSEVGADEPAAPTAEGDTALPLEHNPAEPPPGGPIQG